MLAFEGLLFASLGFAWNDGRLLVELVLAPLGAGVALLTRSSLLVQVEAVHELEMWWDDNRGDYVGPDVVGIRKQRRGFKQILWPWNALPWSFAAAWTIAALISVGR